ncbi:GMC oxidoreductase [Xylariaceae sp. FL0594]|nr:GMC oxidoreductase [Xylariaceae sp. FL0594]
MYICPPLSARGRLYLSPCFSRQQSPPTQSIMGIYTVLPAELQEVDVIIAGGGSAGCVVAARLSDANPRISVLLVEGGPANEGIPSITHPAMLMSNLAPDSKYNIYYKGKESAHLAGRGLVIPAGGVLGGGSSVNLMVYTRPQRSDFESWRIPGWSADDMLRYMNKVETYHGEDVNGQHGTDGPIHVAGGAFRSTRLEEDFIAAVEAAGWPEKHDMQIMGPTNGVQRATRYVDLQGRRQDTAHQYLYPRIQDGRHENLHVLLESRVKRVLFEGTRAVGIEYQSEHSGEVSVKARKMVVVSCGALGSPLLLERSGIGNPSVLQASGVPIIADVPEVGCNYQDHQMMTYSYKSSLDPGETVDAISSGRVDVDDLIKQGDPILGWNSVDAYCKLRPDKADIASLGPALEKEWHQEYEHREDRPLMLATLAAGFPGDPRSIPAGQYFCIAAFDGYSVSRGEIHITGAGLESEPEFNTGIFSDAGGVDIKKHIWMYKKQRQIARSMRTFRGELASTHPAFPIGSRAANNDSPTHSSLSDVEYDSNDDAVIAEWLRKNIGTAWHPLGTCKMSQPGTQGGVVDLNLNVHGVVALKVADLSIVPGDIGCNTNCVAMAVGEKAAEIIIGELGLEASPY